MSEGRGVSEGKGAGGARCADVKSFFCISRGHIHHIDNTFDFGQRLPYLTPLQLLNL